MNKLFLPLHNRQATAVKYGDWLLKFAVSVSWRVLTYFGMRNALTGSTPALVSKMGRAADAWKEFLLGRLGDPGPFQQHILPLAEVEHFKGVRTPANINRYFLRSVDPTIIWSADRAYVYVKMCRILLVGFIEMPRLVHWRGTQVRVWGGTLGGRGCTVPSFLMDKILERAQATRRVEMSISSRQLDVIEKDYRKNLDKFAGSEDFRATHQDVELSGRQTFGFDPDADEGLTPDE